MNRYRIHATVRKTYVAEEDVTFEVEAEDGAAAKLQGQKDADDHADIKNYDAQHEETDNYVSAVTFIEGENPPDGRIPRCDKTIDLFQGET